MTDQEQTQPSEEELRAAYEEQLRQLRVEDVVIQTIVSLVNLGGRRAGLVPGAEAEADAEQLRLAIEAVRSLLPHVEGLLGPDAAALRDAVAELQRAYTRLAVAPAAATDAPAPPPAGEAPAGDTHAGEGAPGPGPAQASGRLWVPGQ